MSKPGIGQWIAGAGGVLLIVSLFLPWMEAQGQSQTGWEFSTMADVFFLIAGTLAVAALLTGGRVTLFRPDLTLNAATDIFGVASSLMLGWLLLFDVPSGADPQAGAFLALAGAVAVLGGAGDYSMFRRGSSMEQSVG